MDVPTEDASADQITPEGSVVGMWSGAFTEPPPKPPDPPLPGKPKPLDPAVAHMCTGVAHALVTLYENHSYVPAAGGRPSVFDERRVPLVGLGSELPAFVFTMPNAGAPHPSAVEDYLRTLAELWGCDATELVTALVLIERAVRVDSTVLQPYTMRLLLLAALAIAAQNGTDVGLTLAHLRQAVAGPLDALEPRALGKAQRQLFRLAGWSVPNDLATYRTYAHHLTTYANLVKGVAEPAPSMENVW